MKKAMFFVTTICVVKMYVYRKANISFLTYLNDHTQFIEVSFHHKRFVQNSSKKKKFNFKK